MRRALHQLQRLLSEGYRIDDVESNDQEILVTVAQGSLCVLVSLDRDDAAAILAGDLDAELDALRADVPVTFLTE